MAFCPNCGKEIDEEDQFCKGCGSKIKPDGDLDLEHSKDSKTTAADSDNKAGSADSDNKLILIPLILGIIGVIVGLIEGLSCPMLFGWINIVTEMLIAVVGGCLGIYLFKFEKEYLIAGIQFVVTGILMAFLIGNMALIGCIIFILAGILAIVLTKKYNVDNKVLLVLPVFTVILMVLVALLMVGVGDYNQNQLANQVTISNVENTIVPSYGYYDGYLKGDIHFDASLDYVSMEVEFLDENGKVLDKTFGLMDTTVKAGKTYQFEAVYMKQEKPYKAQISLKNDVLEDEPFYVQNVTLA